MDKLLPDILQDAWRAVERKQSSNEEYERQKASRFDEYEEIWKTALLLKGQASLEESLLTELGRYVGCEDLSEVRRRCVASHSMVEEEWQASVDTADRRSVEAFYNQSHAEIYGLLWWHTLRDDKTPLAYVTALRFAQQRGCKRFLDFGAGVGSAGVLFATAGFEVALSDISTPLLDFSRWRMELRSLPVQCIDLKSSELPRNAFDMVTTMDVFEHLFDPVRAIEDLYHALKPGGFLFGRFHADAEDKRAGHIVRDMKPTLKRMEELGLVTVWRDDWLWGHIALQRTR